MKYIVKTKHISEIISKYKVDAGSQEEAENIIKRMIDSGSYYYPEDQIAFDGKIEILKD